MVVFKCKMCGASMDIPEGVTAGECQYCGTKQTLPRLDDDRRVDLYDRANHFRRNYEFDKAAGIYEQILNEDSTDAEAYWSLVLCRYGIEYVEDPTSHRHVPTVNRAQYTSIFDDDNYKAALEHADALQRGIYEEEAGRINETQKGFLAISQKEEPFDVFICYKETDNHGQRTRDSVLANDLYHQLTQEGFRVFFSRITLEDKLGEDYEPYIFAALNSAKVMVVLGTKPDHFNAVWVKNEWSRYLALVAQSGGKKLLIPAYKDMDPYDLPKEFSHLQAQDMSKLGFMQDLIRGIKKIIGGENDNLQNKEYIIQQGVSGNVSALLKRGYLALEDREWDKADEFFEEVLNQDAENAQAYLGKLLASIKACRVENLSDCRNAFDTNENYQKVIRFGDEETVGLLREWSTNARCAEIYDRAVNIMKNADSEDDYQLAIDKFNAIPGYQDVDSLVKECMEQKRRIPEKEEEEKNSIYDRAVQLASSNDSRSLIKAIRLLEGISGWKDADSLISKYKNRVDQEYESQLRQVNRSKSKCDILKSRKLALNKYTGISTKSYFGSAVFCTIAFLVCLYVGVTRSFNLAAKTELYLWLFIIGDFIATVFLFVYGNVIKKRQEEWIVVEQELGEMMKELEENEQKLEVLEQNILKM